MKRALGGVFLLGMGLSLGLGACVGEGALVGSNHAGSGGNAGSGGPGSGGPGSGGSGSGGGAGSGGGGSVPRSAPVRTTYSLQLIRAASDVLEPPPFCFTERQLDVDETGRAKARLFAVREDWLDPSSSNCDCTEPGRAPLDESGRALSLDFLRRNAYCDGDQNDVACNDVCFCEVVQAEGESLRDCQENVTPAPDATGWCYVSPENGVGADEVAAQCPPESHAMLRFLGDTTLGTDPFWLGGHDTTAALPVRASPASLPLGAPCLPEDELSLDFSGYDDEDISVVAGTPECDSGVCLVNHFRGRVSCPYGQLTAGSESAPPCFQPGTDLTITVPVSPQLIGRPPTNTVVCSCRCAGPGPGNFCGCPSGMECTPLIGDLGLSGSDALTGSYCIPRGTTYQTGGPYTDRCFFDVTHEACGNPRPY